MKLWKWFAFLNEGVSEERMRAQYREVPNKHLAQIDPSVLTALGLKVYREEVARRQPRASSAPPVPKQIEPKVA